MKKQCWLFVCGRLVGRFDVFTPNGFTPVLTPVEASPAPTVSSQSLSIE